MDRQPKSGKSPPGGVETFASFYSVTVQRTLLTAQRIAGDKDVALDATQEAYVVMLLHWSERREKSLSANHRYVTGIAINKVMDWFRQGSRLEPLGDYCDPSCEEQGYTDVLDELAILDEARRLLDRQPIKLRTVGILYFINGFTYSEVAEALGITSSTVRTQVQRLRTRLRPLAGQFAHLSRGGERRDGTE